MAANMRNRHLRTTTVARILHLMPSYLPWSVMRSHARDLTSQHHPGCARLKFKRPWWMVNLAEQDLEQYRDVLRQLGVDQVSYLKWLQESDLDGFTIPPLHKKQILDMMKEWVLLSSHIDELVLTRFRCAIPSMLLCCSTLPYYIFIVVFTCIIIH